MDTINGGFEMLACLFILPSIMKLHREKQVRGISFIHALFFWVWGIWNLFYYPHLGQWWSFAGGIGVMIANTIWTSQLVLYTSFWNPPPSADTIGG